MDKNKVINLENGDKEIKENEMIYTHRFSQPFEYDEKTLEEVTFNWGKMTGADGLAIENELTALGKFVVSPAYSVDYLVRLAAKASEPKIGVDAFSKMPLKEFTAIRTKAKNFLTGLEF